MSSFLMSPTKILIHQLKPSLSQKLVDSGHNRNKKVNPNDLYF